MAIKNQPRILTVRGTNGNDTLEARYDRASQIFGLGGNDTIRGSIFNDVLDGGDGDDVIHDGISAGSTQDADTLLGGNGNDRLFGGNNDLIDGGAGFDFAQVHAYVDTFGRNAATLNLNVTSTGSLDSGGTLLLSTGTRFTNIESLHLTLDRGNDRISTGASSDEIHAGAGNDTILTLGGDDLLFGDAGKDTLNGGAGQDRLLGGSGLDTLIGGAGADVFVLDQYGSDTAGQFDSGLDRILDFNVAQGDKFDAALGISFSDGGFQIFNDPFAAGYARITDTFEGALVERLIDQGAFQAGDPAPDGIYVASVLFVGVSVAQLGSDFLI